MNSALPKRTSNKSSQRLALLSVLFSVPQLAIAAQPCSIHHAYPEVTRLDVVDGRLVATLGDYFASEPLPDPWPIQLVLSEDDEWRRAANFIPSPTESSKPNERCMEAPLDVSWLKNHRGDPDPLSGFNQEINACTTHEDVTWGGIAFYEGEGSWGVGGLVREDLITGNFEHHRPYGLHEFSVSAIQYYDNQLWIGTTFNGECSGPADGFGLKRYDFAKDKEYNNVREVPGVCGFAVRDFAVLDGDLWVATDLGIARSTKLRDGELTWQNYIPDLGDDRKMRPVGCDALYEELLRTPRLATDTAFDRGYAFEDFWSRLSKLRPEFVSRYLRRLHGHEPAVAPPHQR